MTFYPYDNTKTSIGVSMCRRNYTNGRDSVTVLVEGDDHDREHTLYWDANYKYYSGHIGEQEGFLV
jgi:hypothetical protein